MDIILSDKYRLVTPHRLTYLTNPSRTLRATNNVFVGCDACLRTENKHFKHLP